jgi:hypothetical protein
VNDIVLNVVDSNPVFGTFPEAAELIGQRRIIHIIKIQAPDMVFAAVIRILVGIH